MNNGSSRRRRTSSRNARCGPSPSSTTRKAPSRGTSSRKRTRSAWDPPSIPRPTAASDLDHGTPGWKAGRVEDKMGVSASHTAEVILDDCRIREDNLLGSDEGTAFYGAMKTLESSRPLVASGAVGIARAAYEYALDYSRKRKAFGTPISKKQAIAFMLADMKTKIDAARLLTWRAAWMLDHGEAMDKATSNAKLFAADMAMESTTDAVQILGGAGYMKDEPVEKWMRDAKILQISEGTCQSPPH